jgi:hypothetical protein
VGDRSEHFQGTLSNISPGRLALPLHGRAFGGSM